MERSALALLLALTFTAGTAWAATPASSASADAAAQEQKKATPVDDDPLSDESISGPAAAKSADPGAAKTGPTVLVLPFQPIYRSVPQEKIQLANDLLTKELGEKDLVVLRGGVASGDAAGPSLDGALAAAKEANQAEDDHNIAKAIELRRKVIEEMEKNAAAVEPDDYVAAYHYLARALAMSGADDKALEVIEVAARMRPGFALEPAQFSRLYRSWARKAGEKAIGERPTNLLVRSALPGAAITLDGRAMDVAPVMLEKVVPGRHLIGARIEGVPPYATVVDVKPGKGSEITVSFGNTMGGAAVGLVADAIAENSIPRKAVESAAQAGKEAGATFVVAGGLAKDDDRFHVHSFVIDVSKTKVKPLDVVDFDLEMLTSESDVLRIVQNINATITAFAGGENAIPMIEKRIRSQNTVNQVNAAPSLASEEAIGQRDTAQTKKKRAVFKPLKGTKVQIKDEED